MISKTWYPAGESNPHTLASDKPLSWIVLLIRNYHPDKNFTTPPSYRAPSTKPGPSFAPPSESNPNLYRSSNCIRCSKDSPRFYGSCSGYEIECFPSKQLAFEAYETDPFTNSLLESMDRSSRLFGDLDQTILLPVALDESDESIPPRVFE